ncbi:hypothetical protein KBZ12_15170 [Cyanobium sp. Cruz CV13-4-11]|jgi:hypothetical protein|nr:hypothetical protein [Cyanobium sp. Cruz CV13-4-11]MCP9901854.1 hypothetical protein [Cyanobium sp. Cruz CV11-17]MCP9920791.1 hypothetical protein [Cyanobium sp. Cruz CV13-4-11]
MLNARTIGVATELGFDAAYLLSLWALVFGLQWRLVPLQAAQRHCARPYVLAFTLLAAGDSAHVGLRLLGLARGGLREGLVGYGALATAITVTLFDLLLVQGHQRIGRERWGLLPGLLLALALVRLTLLALPQNHWAAVVPPQPWSLIRNLPLLALTMGAGVLYLGSHGEQQRWQRRIGGLLLVSALCHLPVALWIQDHPLLGLLMIPKSLCYLAMGLIVYRRLPSMAPISSP